MSRRLWCAAAVTACWVVTGSVLAGCGGDTQLSEAPVSSRAELERQLVEGVWAPAMFGEFSDWDGYVERIGRRWFAYETALADCIAAAGGPVFEVVEGDPEGVPAVDPFSDAYVAEYGLGVTFEVPQLGDPSGLPVGADTDDPAVEAILDGDGSSPGCLESAWSSMELTVVDATASAISVEHAAELAALSDTASADPRLVAMLDDWRACMDGRGYSFESAEDVSAAVEDRAAGDEPLEVVQAFELEVAAATWECGGGRAGIEAALQLSHERGVEFLVDHYDDFGLDDPAVEAAALAELAAD